MLTSSSVFKALQYGAAALLLWKVTRTIRRLSSARHSIVTKDRPGPTSPIFTRFFKSKATGLWVYRRQWLPAPDRPVQGVVFLCHGFGEHCGRYEHMAVEMTRAGFAVMGMDHQGHGQSEGDRAYAERFSHLVEDVLQFVKEESVNFDEKLPRFLLGHSLGGLIAAHVVLQSQSFWRGVILSGAALEPDPKEATPFLRFLARTLSNVFPKMGLKELSHDGVCGNPLVVQQYMADPLVYTGGFKVRLASECLEAMDGIMKDPSKFTAPLLLVHGSEDAICRPSGSVSMFERAGSDDKSIMLYPHAKHEVFHELDHAVVVKDILHWLTERA